MNNLNYNVCPVCGSKNNGFGQCPVCKYVRTEYYIDEIEAYIRSGHDLRNRGKFFDATHMYNEAAKKSYGNSKLLCELTFFKILCAYGVQYKYYVDQFEPDVICHYNDGQMNNNSLYREYTEYESDNKYIFDEQLEKIERIRVNMTRVNDEAYQVFICTKIRKEFDKSYNDTNRLLEEKTKEYYYAEKIYDALKNKYKVFFSEVVLQSEVDNYYGVLFNALKRSKIMILIFSDRKNLDAFNVALEWQKFKEKGATIIPVYIGNEKELGESALEYAGLISNQSILSNDTDEIIEKINAKLEHLNIDYMGEPSIIAIKNCVKKMNRFTTIINLFFVISSIMFAIMFEIYRSDYVFNIFLDNVIIKYIILGVLGCLIVILFFQILFRPRASKQKEVAVNKLYKVAIRRLLKKYQREINSYDEASIELLENIKRYALKLKIKDINGWSQVFSDIYSLYDDIEEGSSTTINNKLKEVEDKLLKMQN